MSATANNLPGRLGKALDAQIRQSEVLVAALHMNTGEALAVTSERVIIIKAGWLKDAGPFGAKAISYPFYNISSVEHRQGPLGGHVTILAAGVLENRPNTSLFDRNSNATRENVATYQQRSLRDKVNEIVSLIQEKVALAHRPTPVVMQSSAEDGLADQLLKLSQLHATGVLSADEFAAAKAKLLGTSE